MHSKYALIPRNILITGMLRDQATMNTLRYRSLDQARNEIRLITVHEANKEAEIVNCRLEHVSLDDSLSYKALSYCWGDPNVTRTIHVNRQVLTCCGSRHTTWTRMDRALNQILAPSLESRFRSSLQSMQRLGLDNLHWLVPLIRLRRASQEAEGRHQFRSLSSIITQSSQALATVPRDKIHGILSLTKDGHNLYNATASSDASEDFRTRHIGEYSLVLRANGFIFDVINGLSAVDVDLKSRYDTSEHTDYELVQPDRDRSPYGSKDESFKAL